MSVRESKTVSFFAITLALTVGATAMLIAIPTAQAQTFNVIYTFTGAADGADPVAA